ncbi:hypothetical protein K4K56_001879 [Colletotrichum sp. SAR 10_98]|nr:hypothetical protein K4K56_001879 [Colletotrichum sp. SAR 10_98]
MQPERKYRSILPGPPANASSRSLNDDNGDATSSTSGGVGGQEGSKRKRRGTAKACNNCREKKIGCNGLHPCSHCQRRGLTCEYVAISKTILNSIPQGMKLLDEATAKTQRYAAELLAILRSLPDDQIRDVLQQLRAGGDASNIVAALRGQLHSAYDAPFQGALHGVPPPDQNSLEFELMVRHSIAYSPWAPMELPQLDFEISARPGQGIAVDSPSAAQSLSHVSGHPFAHAANRVRIFLLQQSDQVPARTTRQQQLESQSWCSRQIQQPRSRQSYTAFESEAATWSYAFYDEAAQLLEQDRNLGLLTPVTVAALLYMSMSSMCHAKNTTDATRHLESAIELARSIGLFGIAGEEANEEEWSGAGADVLWNQAMAQTAWGSFVYITVYFHTFVQDLFRPLIRHGDAMRVKLESFTSQQASPEAICAASATQLRRIAATYLQTCASASYSFSWNTALLYVANAASREPKPGIDGSERRFDVHLCLVDREAALADRLAAEFDEIAMLNEFTMVTETWEGLDVGSETVTFDVDG